MTNEEIKEINKECPEDQGVFSEPYGIPVKIKEPVIYMRWQTGGRGGGSCWGTERFRKDGEEEPNFVSLDLVLKYLKPNISYLQYKSIDKIINEVDYNDGEDYYGNYTDYTIKYIILSDLIKYLDTLE